MYCNRAFGEKNGEKIVDMYERIIQGKDETIQGKDETIRRIIQGKDKTIIGVKNVITTALEYKAGLTLKFKCVCVAMYSLVMSLFSRDFLM